MLSETEEINQFNVHVHDILLCLVIFLCYNVHCNNYRPYCCTCTCKHAILKFALGVIDVVLTIWTLMVNTLPLIIYKSTYTCM